MVEMEVDKSRCRNDECDDIKEIEEDSEMACGLGGMVLGGWRKKNKKRRGRESVGRRDYIGVSE